MKDPSDAPDVAIGYYRNVLPSDLSGLAEYETAGGQPAAIVHWYVQWGAANATFNSADLTRVAAHGSVPMITWEPWAGVAQDTEWSLQTAILSGANDAYIEEWARGLAEYGKPVLLRFAHEMHNQPMYPWSVGVNANTAADYLAAWRHVRAVFDQYPTQNVKWVWNPNTLGEAPVDAYLAIYQSLYPGDDQVDFVGIDVFNTGPSLDWGAAYWRSFSDIVAAPYAAISTITSKPIIVAELGCTENGGSKADWIESALGSEILGFPRIKAAVWFDVQKEQAWQLGSSPTTRVAFLSVLSQNRFAASPGLF